MTIEIKSRDQHYEDADTTQQTWEEGGGDEAYAPYRSVSKAAVMSVLAVVFSLLGLLFPVLLAGTLVAIFAGVVAMRNLRRYPNELTGRKAALAGIVGGGLLLIGGIATHAYIYVTEVPEGYERITFEDLQFPEDAVASSLPPLPKQLDGKRVFVKGYIHPGVADMGEIRKFILVPDMGTCCFGGQPALTDMVEVTITGPNGLRYAQIKRKLAGTFHVSYRLKKVAGGLNGGYYALDADYAR
jgi:hypothetical protein